MGSSKPSTEVTGYKLYYGPADTTGSEWYTKVIDVHTVYGIRYLPRQDGKLNGTIVGYEVYGSLERAMWDATPWMRGSWDGTAAAKIEVRSNGQRGRYLKLVATSAADNRPWTSAAEIQIIGEFP